MSRIGELPVEIPQGVQVAVEGNNVSVKGPRGSISNEVHPDMIVRADDKRVIVERPGNDRLHRSLHGLTRSLIQNMVDGVTKGFEKTLVISGVGYRASKQGRKLVLSVGYSHPVEIEPKEGIEIDVPEPTRIVVRGVDKQLVGEVAAGIRAVRQAEPFLGKGIRYEDERVRRKPGKAGRIAEA